MNLLRNSMGVALAAALCLPALAAAETGPPKGGWTLGPPDNSSVLYRNDSFTTKLVDVMVCYEHYSNPGDSHPAPSVMVGQVPPNRVRLKVDLGACSAVSYTVEPESKITLIFSAPEGGTATGSYQLLLP